MYIAPEDLIAVFAFGALLWLWWNAQGAKQRALQATRAYCKQVHVQLLDDAVALRGFWLKRDNSGRWRTWRSYNFEFTSTGFERYSGRIILLGHRVEHIYLEPHRLN